MSNSDDSRFSAKGVFGRLIGKTIKRFEVEEDNDSKLLVYCEDGIYKFLAEGD